MERWGTKKRRKQEGQSLIAAWIEPVRKALNPKKQPEIWDFAEEAEARNQGPQIWDLAEETDAQRERAGTEWWANQTDPDVAAYQQAGQALVDTPSPQQKFYAQVGPRVKKFWDETSISGNGGNI